MNNKWIVGIILVVIIFIGWKLIGNNGKSEDTGPIIFGVTGVLSGDIAYLGEENKNAIELAVNEINASGGVNGRKIELVTEDTKCDGKTAASVAQKLVSVDKVIAIIGPVCSGELLSMAPIVNEGKIVTLTSWALSPDITNAGDYIFRNTISDAASASTTAYLAHKNGIKKIAIITEQTDYAIGFEKSFIESFKKDGGEIGVIESFTSSNKDMRSVVTKIISSKSDAILINAQGDNVGILAKEIRLLGNKQPLYGNTYINNPKMFGQFGVYLEGAYMSEPPSLNPANPKAEHYLNTYKTAYGVEPQASVWSSAAYEAVYILSNAIRDVGENGESIRTYLYNMKNYDGAIGSYRFDNNGDMIGASVISKQIKGGKLIDINI